LSNGSGVGRRADCKVTCAQRPSQRSRPSARPASLRGTRSRSRRRSAPKGEGLVQRPGHHARMSVTFAAIAAGVVGAGLVIGLPTAATYSSNSFSADAWRSVGRSPGRWKLVFWVLPFLVGPAAAVIYFLGIRRALRRTGTVPRITSVVSARIVRGPDQGCVGVASPGRGLYRVVFLLFNYAWFRFDTGRRGAVARDLIEPVPEPGTVAAHGQP